MKVAHSQNPDNITNDPVYHPIREMRELMPPCVGIEDRPSPGKGDDLVDDDLQLIQKFMPQPVGLPGVIPGGRHKLVLGGGMINHPHRRLARA